MTAIKPKSDSMKIKIQNSIVGKHEGGVSMTSLSLVTWFNLWPLIIHHITLADLTLISKATSFSFKVYIDKILRKCCLLLCLFAAHSAQLVINDEWIAIGSEFSNFYAYQLSTQASEAHGKTTQNPVLEPRLLLTCSNPFLLTLRISKNIIEPCIPPT